VLAIWLEHTSEWEILAVHKLNALNRFCILHYIQTQAVEGWLNGAMDWQAQPFAFCLRSLGLPGSKLYISRSDDSTSDHVGAEELSDVAQRFWRVVALGNSNRSFLAPVTTPAIHT